MSQHTGQNEDDWREEFVTQIFRLFKTGVVHEIDNKATQQALDRSAERLGEILKWEEDIVTVLFSGDDIFVNGKPLQADRSVYENLLEFSELLSDVGFNEIGIKKGVTRDDLEALVRDFRQRRKETGSQPNQTKPTPRVRMRSLDADALVGDDDEAELSIHEQVTRVYSASIVTLRRFLNEIKEQDFRLLRYVKRISQRLVPLTDSGSQFLLAVTGMSQTRDEPAGISANSGILAMLMARRITTEFRTLQRVCFAGMITDIGRPRAAGLWDRDNFSGNVIPNLNLEGKERLALSDALILLSNSRVREPALRRATVTYEAGWMENKLDIDFPYDQEIRPSLEALIVAAARRYCELMALEPSMKQRRTPREAFNEMIEEAQLTAERSVLRLLMSTLGYYRRGAIVETTAGWQGVVVEAGESLAEFPQPVLRVVYDPSGNAVDEQDIDLASPEVDLERFGIVEECIDASANRRLKEVAMDVKKASDDPVPTPETTKQSISEPSSEVGSPTEAPEDDDAKSEPEPAETKSSETSGAESGLASLAVEDSPVSSSSESASEASSSAEPSPDESAPAEEADDSDIDADLPEIRGLDDADNSDEGVGAGGNRVEITSTPEGGTSISSGPGESSSPVSPSSDTSRPPEADSGGSSGERSRANSLDAMAGDIDDEDDGDLGDARGVSSRTRQVSAEESRDLLGDQEDASSNEDLGASELGSLAEGADTPDEENATRQVDSRESKQILDNFVDDAGGDDPSATDAAGTGTGESAGDEDSGPSIGDLNMGPDESASSSSTTREPTSPDDGSRDREPSRSSQLVEEDEDPNDSRLGDLASDIDDDVSTQKTTEHVSSEKSREMIDNYVEEGPQDDPTDREDDLQDLVSEQSGEESEAEDDGTRQVSAEESKELLASFVESESGSQDAVGGDESTRSNEAASRPEDGESDEEARRRRRSSVQVLESLADEGEVSAEPSGSDERDTGDSPSGAPDEGAGEAGDALAQGSGDESPAGDAGGTDRANTGDALALGDDDDSSENGAGDEPSAIALGAGGGGEAEPGDEPSAVALGAGGGGEAESGDEPSAIALGAGAGAESGDDAPDGSDDESSLQLDRDSGDPTAGGDPDTSADFGAEQDDIALADESTGALDTFDPDDEPADASNERTRQVSSEESQDALSELVDDSPDAGGEEEATRQVSSEESAQVLDQFVDDAPGGGDDDGASGGEEEATRQVSSEESAQVLDQFVDDAPGGGSDDDQNVADAGEEEATRQVSSEESAQVLDQFVDDAPGGGSDDDQNVADAGEEEATRQVSSEESAQVLDQFVDDAPGGGSDDDQDVADAGEEEATRQVSAEESAQVLDQFVDDAPGGGGDGSDEDGSDDEESPPALGELATDSDRDAEKSGSETAVPDSGADQSSGLEEDTSPEEVEPTQQLDRDESRDVLSDYIDGLDDES